MSEIKDFKDLKIWQKGMIIAEKCFFLTQKFPREEQYSNMISFVKSSLT